MIGQWKAQFRRMMLSPGFETPEEECAAILAKLTADGSFADVDYADKQPNYWGVIPHFERTMALFQNRRVQNTPELRERALTALRFWLA